VAGSVVAQGTWAELTADGAVTRPGTPQDGDRYYLFASWKDFSVTAQVTSPEAWTEVAEFASGAVAAGNGTGSMKVAAWYRDWVTGDGNPTIDFSASPNIAGAVAVLMRKGATDLWDMPLFVTAAITSATNWTATSTTALEDDGSPNVTWNGNVVETVATHLSTTTGFDMAADLIHRLVTTGAAGVNLTATGTLAASDPGAALWVHQGTSTAEQHSGGVTATGGGVLTSVRQKGAQVGVAATGGGILTFDAEALIVENHDGAVVATGGGVATVGLTTARSRGVVASGGGVQVAAATTDRPSVLTAAGGGIATVGQSAERSGSVVATGGGSATVSTNAARLGAALMSGGGVLTTDQATNRLAGINATGGGAATVTGTAGSSEEHFGAVAATGGGSASVAYLVARQVGVVASGGGAFAFAYAGGHEVGFTATGGGSASFGQVAPIPIEDAGLLGLSIAPATADILIGAAELGLEIEP